MVYLNLWNSCGCDRHLPPIATKTCGGTHWIGSGPMDHRPMTFRSFLCAWHSLPGSPLQGQKAIMRAASTQDTILFNETPVMLLPDLSCQTLSMRKALKPLTQLLQARKIKYQWHFPFHIRVHHDGKTAIFCTLGDLPTFLSILELPQVSLPDWPFTPTIPGLPFVPQWQKQGCKWRSRSSSNTGPNNWMVHSEICSCFFSYVAGHAPSLSGIYLS